MRHDALNRASQVFLIILLISMAGIALILAQVLGLGRSEAGGLRPLGIVAAAWDRDVVLISGHAGYDSGAVCEDITGAVTLTEAEVNARIAALTAERLRRVGASVAIFDEYDERLQGLRAAVLLSLHADSCIEASGFKAAVHRYSVIPKTNQRLLHCINTAYPVATGLPPHPDTVTHDMTEYHAFRRIAPTTPAAILEMGFLGGDRALLTEQAARVAKGVSDAILCFLESEMEKSNER